MEGIPDDLPVIERDVVRLVVLDSAGNVLLFHTRDPVHTDLGTWWELPGGGLDLGETYVQAAVRELREEAGIKAEPGQVGPATWRRLATFRHHENRRVQHEVIATVRLAGPGGDIDGSGRLPHEVEDYFDFRWWPVAEVVGSRERFYPGRLPELLLPFLAGQEIDEPLELWS
jgi:8-oxo-dGTP pyrophosphatase MutT (NUDIX family)